jgi:hypothetical protein
MARDDTRWLQVGVLFRNDFRDNELSGSLTFGLLGEVKVWAKPRESKAGKTYWTLVCREADLPGLLVLNRAPGHRGSSAAADDDEARWAHLLAEAETFVEPEDREQPPEEGQ